MDVCEGGVLGLECSESSPYSQRLHCLKQNQQGFRPLQKEKLTAAALTRLSLSHSGGRTVLDIKIIPFP